MANHLNNELGLFLRELRGHRSLREIGKLTGLSHSYIRQLELGHYGDANKSPLNPSVEAFHRLGKVYNVSPRVLMDKANIEGELLSAGGANFSDQALSGSEYETLYLYQKLTKIDQEMIKLLMRRLLTLHGGKL